MAQPSKGLRLAVSATRRISHLGVARAAGAAAKCTAPRPLMTAPRVPNAAPAAATSSTLPTMKFGSLTSRAFGRAALHMLVAVMPGHRATKQRHVRHARAPFTTSARNPVSDRAQAFVAACVARVGTGWKAAIQARSAPGRSVARAWPAQSWRRRVGRQHRDHDGAHRRRRQRLRQRGQRVRAARQ